jgi:eukaryotic-like serine/threonine-protein kinase
MTAERWKQVRALFDAVLEMPPAERPQFLAGMTDPELRSEVEGLLRSFDESADLIEEPAAARLAPMLDASNPEFMTGRMVGHYRLIRRIGSGGMGSVYEAARADQEYEKRVAIKVVKPGLYSHTVLHRFLNERQMLAELDHPNISRLLDGGTTPEGMPYLVMEYVDGVTIDRFCDAHKLTVTQRLDLFRPVCDAVQYAHRNLIIHRDIKPANILVTQEGVPKLLDFGIAKLLGDSVGVTTHGLTADAVPMTPEYASPEQVLGQPVTTASDLYALGVLLYYLLTGHSPYRLSAWTAPRLFHAITEADPERPSEVVLKREEYKMPDGSVRTIDPEEVAAARRTPLDRLNRHLRGDLDTILLTALRKESSRRYPSVERLSEDLRLHLAGHPISARGDSVAYRTSKFVARHRIAVVVGVLFTLGLIGSTITSAYYASVARHEQAVAEHRFQGLRELARFVLFEFDEAIRAGETAARKSLVARALTYLDQLARESAGDASLQKEMAEGYLKIGDVQGNLYGPNVGEGAGAERSYRRAAELAAELVADHPGNQEYESLMARAHTRLGDLVALGGDRKLALDYYRRAMATYQRLAGTDPPAPMMLPVIDTASKIAFVQSQTGDLKGARQSYEEALSMARSWLAAEPENRDARRWVALAEARSGELLARDGELVAGLERLQSGLARYERLAVDSPGNATARRNVSATSMILGDLLLAVGRHHDAVRNFQLALEASEELAAQDPGNVQYRRDTHIALGRLAEAQFHLGQRAAARESTVRALAVLHPLVRSSEAEPYDMQQYTWLLLTTPFAELRDPVEALPYAERVVEATNASDPGTLELLAQAQFAVGQRKEAIATLQQAIRSLPPQAPGDPPSPVRRELEESLARFEAAGGGRPQ